MITEINNKIHRKFQSVYYKLTLGYNLIFKYDYYAVLADIEQQLEEDLTSFQELYI